MLTRLAGFIAQSRSPHRLSHLLSRITLLLLVPAAVLATGVAYQRARGPYWLGTNVDPAYTYLINSLRLARLHPPLHVDHPGTTVQSAGALTLRLVHSVSGGSNGLEDDVLQYPEFYLRILTGVFLCLYVVLLYVCGSIVLDVMGSFPLAWVVQATPFLSLNAFLELADVKPEPVLLSVGAAMMAAIAGSLDAGRPNAVRLGRTIGLLTGFAVATKVTALSLCAIPLALLPRRGPQRAWALAVAGGFFVCVTPILGELRRLLRFGLRVATGPGLYGANQFADQLNPWALQREVIQQELPFFTIAVASVIACGFLAWSARRREIVEGRRALFKALLALVAVDAVQVVLFFAQPYQARYLLPALGLVGLNLALLLKLVCFDQTGRARPVACLLVAATAASTVGLQARRLANQVSWLRAVANWQLDARRTAESFAPCRIVNYYRSSSLPGAFRQANANSGFSMGRELQRLHPDALFLNGGVRLFFGHAGVVGGERWGQRWACLVFQGSPGGPSRPFSGLDAFDRAVVPVRGPLELAFAAPVEAVRVSGSRALAAIPFYGWTSASGLGEMEGPYPESGLPVVRWGLGPESRLTFQGAGQRMRLLVEGKPGVAGQELKVLVNGRKVARHAYSNSGDFEPVALVFESTAGRNEVVLRYRRSRSVGGRALAVLFRRLRISEAAVEFR